MKTNEQIHQEALENALSMAGFYISQTGAITHAIQKYLSHISAAISEADEVEAIARNIYNSRNYLMAKDYDEMVAKYVGDDKPESCWKRVHRECIKSAKSAIAASRIIKLVRGDKKGVDY